MCCKGVIGLMWFRIGSRDESLKMECPFFFQKIVRTFSRDSFLLRYDTASMGRLVPTLPNMRALSSLGHRDPVAH